MQTLANLLRHLPSAQAHGPEPAAHTFNAVTSDSRAVAPGALFVAVVGGAHDGHLFLADASDRGAAALIGARSRMALGEMGVSLPADLPYIQVDDPRKALAVAAALLYDFPSRSMTVIGVTGTDGKTSTTTLLEAILADATRSAEEPAGAVGVISTLGARIRGREQETGLHVTTPDAPDVQQMLAQMRAAGCRYVVVESTSHGLAQSRVAAVDFDVAAVTNITHEHLDYHGTRDAYVAAKATLFRALSHTAIKPGVAKSAILNADDDGSFDALRTTLAAERRQSGRTIATYTYGLSAPSLSAPDADTVIHLWAEAVRQTPQQTTFELCWRDQRLPIRSALIGEFNIYNMLCAAAAALALQIEPHHIQAGIAAVQGIVGRMQRIDEGQPFLALVDFAHSPASLERALLTLAAIRDRNHAHGRLIAVFGSAGLRDVAKRALMGEVSGRLADFTIITAEDPRTEDLDAINAAIAAGVRRHAAADRLRIVPDRAQAIQAAVSMAAAGDIVCAFGKGHERSMCYGVVETPWSDQDALRDALRDHMTHRP